MKEIDFSPAKISEAEKNRLLIKAVNDRPNAATSYGKAKLNSTETKDIFDKPFEMSVERHNALVDKVIELQAEVSDAIENHASAVAVEIERQDGEIEAIRGVADDANIYVRQAHMFASDAVLEAEAAKQRSEAAIGTANQLRADADAGVFTPKKGTDYWTAADKAEMVADVIAALPKYGGEVVSV